MQTRRLRLGDVVDDYCPRERRLSNHVVVAMVDDAIKQTRCSTCDFEHPYKDGKLPARRKKKDATAELYQQVLEGMTEKPPSAPVVVPERPVAPPPVAPPVVADPPPMAMAAGASSPAAASVRPAATNLRSRTAKAKAAAAASAAASASAPAAASAPASASAPPARIAPPAAAPRAASAAPARTAPPSGEAPRLAPPPIAAAPAAGVEPSRLVSPAGTAPAGASHQAASRHAVPHEAPKAAASEPADNRGDEAEGVGPENEPLHRRTLIRAQLPRPVGEVPTRQAPTFTIREAAHAPKFRRPFARNARPQGGQHGVVGNTIVGRPGARNGQQPRGKKGGAPQGGHRFGQQGHGQGQGGHHAKGRQGNQGNKRFK